MLGGLIVYHYFTLGKKKLTKKKVFKALTEKIMAHSQISFKGWLNTVDSELYTYFFQSNTMVA